MSSPSLWELLAVYVAILSLKLLLLPAPYSTDLEVHRHWKALTFHKPLSEWYIDTSSKWTLDYPPLFAYFEYVMAAIIARMRPSLLSMHHSGEHSNAEVTVLRLSVMACEPLLLYSITKLVCVLQVEKHRLRKIIMAMLLPGLTLVDNIHFQYNQLPLSFVLLSLYHLTQNNNITSTILFCVTLNFKQTFLTLSPVIVLSLLNNIHRTPQSSSKKLVRAATIALTAALTTLIPWLPFIYNGTYKAALRRIFPFQRGLLHANWAPNIWSPYAALDRLLIKLFSSAPTTSTTKGIINIANPFSALPNPTPLITILLTLFFLSPFIRTLLNKPSPTTTVTTFSAAAVSSFLFGYHVHEKAILLTLVPLSLTNHRAFPWISIGGQFALFELLRHPGITPFLIAHFIAFHAAIFATTPVSTHVKVYFLASFLVEAYCGVLSLHRSLFANSVPFLPIILVSLYAFVGVAVGYLHMVQHALKEGKSH